GPLHAHARPPPPRRRGPRPAPPRPRAVPGGRGDGGAGGRDRGAELPRLRRYARRARHPGLRLRRRGSRGRPRVRPSVQGGARALPDLVVTDTSCLIALDRVRQLDVLPALFAVHAPPAVVAEFGWRPAWLHVESA